MFFTYTRDFSKTRDPYLGDAVLHAPYRAREGMGEGVVGWVWLLRENRLA